MHILSLYLVTNSSGHPNDVSLDSDGFVYVTEWYNHCITKLTTTGEYIARFHSKGSGRSYLQYPICLTINNNLVYVSEWGNNRVFVFDTKGTFLHCFGKSGEFSFYIWYNNRYIW